MPRRVLGAQAPRSTGTTRRPAWPTLRRDNDLRLDADLRFRGSVGVHLHDLQAGQEDRVEGVFQRVRLGARFATPSIEARLQLQVSGAFGAKGPGEQPVPVGLQAGTLRWLIPSVKGLEVELGRMALEYGSGRHIARYDFHDEGNAYDGLRVRFAIDRWLRIDALGVKLRRNTAQPEQERNLFGVVLVGRPFLPLTTDVYLLVLRDGSTTDRANFQTMGLRLVWNEPTWLRLETEVAVQAGTVQPAGALASLDLLASAVSAEVGLALGRRAGLTFRFDSYSGDDGSEPDVSHGWRPLYPDLVRHVGLLQLFAPTGLRQWVASARIGPRQGLRLETDVRLTSTLAGGRVPGFSRPLVGDMGGGWVQTGTEVDVALRWPAFPGSELLVATGVFFPSTDLAAKLGNQRASQLLLQWTSRF